MEESIFTKIIRGDVPCYKIYETDSVLAFLDINPKTEGHTLVIPKKHPTEFVWDLDGKMYIELMQACKKLALHLREVSGKAHVHQAIVGTDVPYAHIHLMPFDKTSELHERSAADEKTLSMVAEKYRLND